MRGLAITVTSLLLVWVGAPRSTAEIYRWTDAQGRLHFAQSLDQVPPAHRAKAQEQSQAGGKARPGGSFQTFSDGRGGGAATGPRVRRSHRIPFHRENGLMRVNATVNGHLDVPFYIDTGASGVSIPAGYARSLGIHVGPDTDRITVRTANGIIQVPLVRIDSVKLGGARVEGLMGTLNPTMNIGLLGGEFFNRFSYEVDPAASVITLVPNHAVTTGLGEDHWRRRFRSIRKPLAELESYLENEEGLRPGRRADLESKRLALIADLEALDLEANRFDVPGSWRH